MILLRRLRTSAGPWTLVGLLVATMVAVVALTDAVRNHLDDQALRASMAAAPYVDRDLIVERTSRSGLVAPPSAAQQREGVQRVLPAHLADVVGQRWAYQRTSVSQMEGVGASLVGEGVTGEPDGLAPVASLHTQLGIGDEVEVVTGRLPDNPAGDGVLEVAVSVATAETVGLGVPGGYHLQVGRMGIPPDELEGRRTVPVRVVGTFLPDDGSAATWDHAPVLLEPGMTAIVREMEQDPSALRIGLLTDPGGLEVVAEAGLTTFLAPATMVRVALDREELTARWAEDADRAVAQLAASPELHGARVRTGLPEIVEGFRARVAAVTTIVGLMVTWALGLGVALLLVGAGMLVERRREELRLWRARGAWRGRIARELLREALPVVLGGAVIGWWGHAVALRALTPGPMSGAGTATALAVPGPLELAIVAVGLAVVPGAALVVTGRDVVAVQRTASARHPGPGRLTLELAVVLLAGVGTVVTRQRGLVTAEADPFLSTVPLLLAVAGGLVVLRALPWPLRAFEPLARRRRGPLAALALARMSRSAPSTLWALLVVVVAAAATGFASTLLSSLSDAGGADGLIAGGPFHTGLVALLRGGAVVGVAAALLTVGLLLVMPAADRAHDLHLLRALGLRGRTGRALVLLEVVPVVVLASVAGLVIGAAVPEVLGPGLGIEHLVGAPPATSRLPATVAIATVAVIAGVAAVGTLVSSARSTVGAMSGGLDRVRSTR